MKTIRLIWSKTEPSAEQESSAILREEIQKLRAKWWEMAMNFELTEEERKILSNFLDLPEPPSRKS